MPVPRDGTKVARTRMTWESGQSLISIADLDRGDILRILETAGQIVADPERYRQSAAGKILATLFYEASTRTRLSFESAMLRLGGQVISVADIASSSVRKGETLADTVRMVSGYADAIALRHPEAGAAREASQAASVPVVNAGDGTGEHPTQALLDAYTIRQHFGTLDHLTVTFVGDLRYGRTVHSLSRLLANFPLHAVYMVAAPGLEAPPEMLHAFSSIPVHTSHPLVDAARVTDVLYVTRVQRERLPAHHAPPSPLVVDESILAALPTTSVIMHPLPRQAEVPERVDRDARAVYFEQARNGVPVRMAVLNHLLLSNL